MSDEAHLEKFVPLMKRSKGIEELKKLVIDTGMCSRCGTCAAFCDRIEMGRETAELVKDCTLETGSITCNENGTCYDHCPHISFSIPELEKKVFSEVRKEEELGYYKKIVAARSKYPEILKNAQDGGAVSTLLLFALEKGYADGAIVADRNKEWETFAGVVKGKEELARAAGTKYLKTPTIETVGKALRGEFEEAEKFGKIRKLAVVGTGCQTTGARKLFTSLFKEVEGVEPTIIGLFCFENFPYECLKNKIEELFGVDIREIVKTDITAGKFIITTKNGEVMKKSVKLFDECINDACNMCTNFTSTFADISVGSIGTAQGWSTVITRTQEGWELLEKAQEEGYLEITSEVDVEEIKRIASFKYKKRDAKVKERQEKGLYIPDYS